MVTIRCFSHSDCNIPLIMTNLCSNFLILRIESITLVNDRDFSHCAAWAVLSPIWKQRHYFLYRGSFYDVVEIEEQFWIRQGRELGLTGVSVVGLSDISVVLWFFFWGFQNTVILHQYSWTYITCYCYLRFIRPWFLLDTPLSHCWNQW